MAYSLACSRGTGGANGWLFWADNGADNKITFRTYNGTTRNNATSTNTITVGAWMHIVGAYDGSNTRLYINGQEACAPVAGAYVPQTSLPLYIAGAYNDATSTFDMPGSMDEFAVYNTVLPPATILSHYQNGTNAARSQPYDQLVQASTPVGYWRFNETVTPTAANLGTLGAGGTAYYFSGIGLGEASMRSPTQPGFDSGNTGVTNTSTNGYVQSTALGINTNSVTLECWIKPNGVQPAYAGILFARAGSATTSGIDYNNLNGTLGYHWSDGQYGWNSYLSPIENEWNYVALTIEPTKGTMYLYNASYGWLKAENVTAHGNANFADGIRIGIDNGSRAFQGSIDEVAVYGKTLTEGQLRTHALAGVGTASAQRSCMIRLCLAPHLQGFFGNSIHSHSQQMLTASLR